MVFTPYPYLDQLAWRLRELPEMQALVAANNYGQSVTQVVRHKFDLGPKDRFNDQQRKAGTEVIKAKVARSPGGEEAFMAGFEAIEAQLTPDVIQSLCRALVPECVPDDPGAWFTIWSQSEGQLHELLFHLVFVRMSGTTNRSTSFSPNSGRCSPKMRQPRPFQGFEAGALRITVHSSPPRFTCLIQNLRRPLAYSPARTRMRQELRRRVFTMAADAWPRRSAVGPAPGERASDSGHAAASSTSPTGRR